MCNDDKYSNNKRRLLKNVRAFIGTRRNNEVYKKDVINLVEEEDVEFIRLQFTDMFGTMKNVAITASQLEKALDNKCMFDGASIDGFVRVEESDMYLHPDLDTLEIFPWRPQQGKVARLICDVYTNATDPFEGDPRYVLKRCLMKQRKWAIPLM